MRETNDGVCLTGLCVVYVREGANSLHPHLTLSCLPGATQLQATGVFSSSFITISQPQPCEFFSFVGVSFTQRAHCFLFFIRRKNTNKKQTNSIQLPVRHCICAVYNGIYENSVTPVTP